MDNYIAVIFDSDVIAADGLRALGTLNHNGDVTVHGAAVIRRLADGTLDVTTKHTAPGLRTALGLAFGAILGMFAGPAGIAAGAYAGGVAGMAGDVIKSGEHSEAAIEVEAVLRPGHAAIIAEVSEDLTSPIDPTMKALGGRVYRRPKGELRHAFFDAAADSDPPGDHGYFADPSA